jgi:hypothetical protein
MDELTSAQRESQRTDAGSAWAIDAGATRAGRRTPAAADAVESKAAGPGVVEPKVPAAVEDESSSGGIVGHLHSVAGPVAGVIGSVIEAANQAWSIREGVVARRLGRQAREPLANLFDLYPEARQASPHELGMRFVPVEEIRGTAVAGAAQRGGDFLPLKPFRGENWEARWRRLRDANDRLQPLPPVDLIKFDGDYWVVDGHNRVAVTLYANGVGLDAMVTELVPLDGQTSERPRNLLSYLGETGELRAAAGGHRPAMGMRHVEQLSSDEAAVMPEDEREARDEADAGKAADAAARVGESGSLGEAD